MKKRASYTKAFKLEAVRLMRESERPASEVARELGVRRNQLYKWQEEYEAKGDAAFAGSGRPKKDAQSELARLRQENIRLQEENEILKKAAVDSMSRRNRYSKCNRYGELSDETNIHPHRA